MRRSVTGVLVVWVPAGPCTHIEPQVQEIDPVGSLQPPHTVWVRSWGGDQEEIGAVAAHPDHLCRQVR